MINIICTIVKITFWEVIDQTNLNQLLYSAVNPANGFRITCLYTQRAGPEATAKSALLSSLSAGAHSYTGVHVILRFISSERDFQSVSVDPDR